MQHISIPSNPPMQGSIGATIAFEIKYNTPGIAEGKKVTTIKADANNPVWLQFTWAVLTVFNAGTTNVLTVGTNAATADQYVTATNIQENTISSTTQTVRAHVFTDTPIFIKYTQTGTAATAGLAIIHMTVTPLAPYNGGLIS